MKFEDLIRIQDLSVILGINEPNTRIWVKKNLIENKDYKKFERVYIIDKNKVLKKMEKVKNK